MWLNVRVPVVAVAVGQVAATVTARHLGAIRDMTMYKWCKVEQAETSATLLGTSALLVVTRFAIRNKKLVIALAVKKCVRTGAANNMSWFRHVCHMSAMQ